MEFDEHEDQDEGIGMQLPPNYDSMGRLKVGSGAGGEGVSTPTARKVGGGSYRYKECLKNHAVGIGGSAVDGCGEFMAAGEEGTLDALKCAACNCHRNFHRKELEGEIFHHQQQQQHHPLTPYYHHHRATTHPAGYLHVTPMTHQRPLALPSNSREDMEDMTNPSSSGGGGGGGGSSSRKRFRTKFTQEQKDKMLELAERLGWRIQKQDEAAVQQFCGETGVKRHVLKVWMHNNKHTIGKKP